MAEITKYKPGTFSWVELSTTDGEGAKRFYSSLFGWTSTDNPIGGGQFYTMLHKDGKDVGALFERGPRDGPPGAPPFWASYVTVASADESAAKAADLGAKVVKEPFDVMDHGRMAVLQDPVGAAISLWEPRRHIGASLVNQPGSFCWNELAVKDAEAARAFYTALFGWTYEIQEMGPMQYTTFKNDGLPAAGLFPPSPEMGAMPVFWLVYFAVEDCDASAEKVGSLGGKIVKPPADIPGVGRFAIAADPQGAGFAIIKLTMPAA
jgi:predicted enzyme related to lactoylglutathione lyase